MTGAGGANWLDAALGSLSTVCCERTLRALYARADHRQDEITEAKERERPEQPFNQNDSQRRFGQVEGHWTCVVAHALGDVVQASGHVSGEPLVHACRDRRSARDPHGDRVQLRAHRRS